MPRSARTSAGPACARCKALGLGLSRECGTCIRARWAKEDGKRKRVKNGTATNTRLVASPGRIPFVEVARWLPIVTLTYRTRTGARTGRPVASDAAGQITTPYTTRTNLLES